LMPLLVFLVVWAIHSLSPVRTSTDSMWSIHTAVSIIDRGNTNLDAYRDRFDPNRPAIEEVNGHYYTIYPLGASLIAVPFVLVLERAVIPLVRLVPRFRTIGSNPVSGAGLLPAADYIVQKHARIEVLIASAIVALTAVFVYLIGRRGLGPGLALLLTLVFAFGTSAWSVASRALWQHGPAMLMLAVVIYIILRAKTSPGIIQYAGLPLAFSFVIRPTNAVPIILFTIYVFLKYRNYLLRFLLWSLPVAVPFFAYNFAVYHAPLSSYYHGLRASSPAVFFEGLAAHLIRTGRGLFVFSPVLLFAFYGVFLKVRDRKFELLDGILLVIIAGEWLVMSSYWTGWAGYSFGARFFTDLMPLFAYLLVPVVAEMAKAAGRRKVALATVFLILLAGSLFINYRGANDWATRFWNVWPVPFEDRPNRIWDWHDVQFLRGLKPSPPAPPPMEIRYHLTARPWQPLNISRDTYLNLLEGVVRFTTRYQNSSGAVFDPFSNVEMGAPVYGIATLVANGRAPDLLDSGISAMDHLTQQYASDFQNDVRSAIVFNHTPLTEAIKLFTPLVSSDKVKLWRNRMSSSKVENPPGYCCGHNWRTYAMRGEWTRAQAGLISRDEAVSFIEHAWLIGDPYADWGAQRDRILNTRWNLYHDYLGDPDSLSVETAGRGNLLALIHEGYDGASAGEIRSTVERGTQSKLLFMDPTGQTPCNGRTDDHVWVDVGHVFSFDVMAERAQTQGKSWLAGQFRHAAMLSLNNIARWRRTDGSWAGSYYVTKNHFDPVLRVGYQDATYYIGYNGGLAAILADAYNARKTGIVERPAPAEIGGYALSTDNDFASAVANAGGMQLQLNTRGDTHIENGNWWTPLGVVRFGRVNWDTRLGPSDGAWNGVSGVSFAPTFQQSGKWIRLASVPDRYQGTFSVLFTHPLLGRVAVDYMPKRGQRGPSFHNEFVITPDGILSTVSRTAGSGSWGMTWPLLEYDGRDWLVRADCGNISRTRYSGGTDEQNFIALNSGSVLDSSDGTVRSTYGDLRPVRVTISGAEQRTFIYPRSTGDPTAEAVRDSFQYTSNTQLSSVLGRVQGTLYVGRTSAGGVGDRLDVSGSGTPDVTFSAPCGFVLQLQNGVVTAVETDRDVTGIVQGRSVTLTAFMPLVLAGPSRRFLQ
jgi:hypothetical protein